VGGGGQTGALLREIQFDGASNRVRELVHAPAPLVDCHAHDAFGLNRNRLALGS
jgi:hypothetical protein